MNREELANTIEVPNKNRARFLKANTFGDMKSYCDFINKPRVKDQIKFLVDNDPRVLKAKAEYANVESMYKYCRYISPEMNEELTVAWTKAENVIKKVQAEIQAKQSKRAL